MEKDIRPAIDQESTAPDKGSADEIAWVTEEQPLPPAKRPSTAMSRCDGTSGVG